MNALAAFLAVAPITVQSDIPVGTVIDDSVTFTGGEFTLPSDWDGAFQPELEVAKEAAAIVIRGDDIVVDFGGAVIQGTPQTVEPDERTGTGILIEGDNVTLRNVTVRGYKVGILADGTDGLVIEDVDTSFNYEWRQRSNLEGEDTADWMSYHDNNEDQWLRFGTGIYVRDADDWLVRNSVSRNANNGLMLTDSHNGLAYNNDFSFNSAIGLAMYRSSDNRIMHNKLDWNVRGYSHGVYNRGQDSTGILIYEQAHRNVFAYNSVTHGGDGFFLWAGNTSMDTGAGGANDNVLYGNDWSHAPTNGIESTFSRNFFVNNLIMECWHGIWGGYSFENQVIGNVFALNAEAIAWEHGNNNLVMHNLFHRDLSALAIWANPTEGDWPYANNRDTESRGWFVHNNLFEEIPDNALNVRGTEDFLFYNNTLSNVAEVFDMETDRVSVRAFGEGYGLDFSNFVFTGNRLNASTLELPDSAIAQNNVQDRAMPSPAPMTMNLRGEVYIDGNWDLDDYMERFEAPVAAWNPWKVENPSPERLQIETWAPEPLEDGIDPFLGMDVPRGRRMILIGEWGPIDFFNTPTLFPRTVEGMLYTEEYAAEREGSNTRVFEVLGPDGEWEVTELRGVESINKRSGMVPDVIEVEFDPQAQDIGVVIEYTGEQDVFDYRGIVTPAGQPFEMEWSDFRLPIDWQVAFWNWDVETQHPEENESAFMNLIESEPIYTTSTEELNYNWGAGPIAVNLPADHFATLAVGEVDVEPGTYTLSITSDDGVRVWVDGEMIVDEWQWQPAALFERELELSGEHEIRILHFEIDGGATLKATLEPAN